MIPFFLPLLSAGAPAPAVMPVQSAPIVQRAAPAPAPARAPAPVRVGGNMPVIPLFLGGSDYLGRIVQPGRTPYEWGISRACRQMVRANKCRAARGRR